MLVKSQEDLLKRRKELQDRYIKHEEKYGSVRLLLRRKLIRAFGSLWMLDINPDYFPIELVENALNEDPLYISTIRTLKHDGYKVDAFVDVLSLALEARLIILHKDNKLLRNAYKTEKK